MLLATLMSPIASFVQHIFRLKRFAKHIATTHEMSFFICAASVESEFESQGEAIGQFDMHLMAHVLESNLLDFYVSG